jgi:hypothetical protein
MLQISTCIVFSILPIISCEIHLFSNWVILSLSHSMGWINQRMFHIIWSQWPSIMRGIYLKSLPESCIENVWIWSLMSLITKWFEWIVMLYVKHSVIWEWVGSPVTRLNDTVWWVTKVIYFILDVIRLKKSLLLSFW